MDRAVYVLEKWVKMGPQLSKKTVFIVGDKKKETQRVILAVTRLTRVRGVR